WGERGGARARVGVVADERPPARADLDRGEAPDVALRVDVVGGDRGARLVLAVRHAQVLRGADVVAGDAEAVGADGDRALDARHHVAVQDRQGARRLV